MDTNTVEVQEVGGTGGAEVTAPVVDTTVSAPVVAEAVAPVATAPVKREKSARQELTALLKAQKQAGVKRRDIALVLFGKGYTEAEVGKVMGVHAKTAHAFKIDFSKKGKEKAEKSGKRVHLNPDNATLKRIDGHKVTGKLVNLVNAVLGRA